MGPAARMKIDRVVFKSGRAVSELVVTAEAGALRWNSGVSQSNAYLIKTPTVIIKVRGTTFDLFAEPQKTTVVLRSGTIEVCTIDTPQRCQRLSRPGDWVIGTPNVLDRPRRAGPGPSNFADRCLSARAMAPCAILASVQPTRSGSVTPRTTPSVTPATKVIRACAARASFRKAGLCACDADWLCGACEVDWLLGLCEADWLCGPILVMEADLVM